MIKFITTILLALTLLSFNQITQTLKKLLGALTKFFLKIINALGIKIVKKEQGIRTSLEFQKVYKGIKKVKISKKNTKKESYIDWANLGLLIFGAILYILNFKMITNNMVSNWLYGIIENVAILKKFVADANSMNVFYTSGVMAIITFSATKLATRWKETKPQRKAMKEMKLKLKAMDLMTSKELLDNAKKKDEEEYKKARGDDDNGTNTQ